MHAPSPERVLTLAPIPKRERMEVFLTTTPPPPPNGSPTLTPNACVWGLSLFPKGPKQGHVGHHPQPKRKRCVPG
jgi:hypothetical protein